MLMDILSKVVLILGSIIAIGSITICLFRYWKLSEDKIQNPYQDPYLDFAEQQRHDGKQMFSPWTTTDQADLNIAKQYFSDIPIPHCEQLKTPHNNTVKIEVLKESLGLDKDDSFSYFFVAVGGPPAAMVALQQAMNGNSVLYVNNSAAYPYDKTVRPIWAGSAFHGEPDAVTEAPAYTMGYEPRKFLWSQLKAFINPPRFDKEVLRTDFSWLSLNIFEWLINPKQLVAGLRVAWGNYQLAKIFAKEIKEGKQPHILQEMKERTHHSGEYLEWLNHQLGGILRLPRGSLMVAPDNEGWKRLEKNREALQRENQILKPIALEEAKVKYGIIPRNVVGFMEKTHDFIFEPRFLDRIIEGIKENGGKVITHWHLKRVLINTGKNNEDVLEFYETTNTSDKIYHHCKFSHAHLSLGSTQFTPDNYPLISVTGVSINALIYGVKLSGGPIVFGESSNMVPLAEPKTVTLIEPTTGEKRTIDVSFVRVTSSGSVGPADRGRNWYNYDGRHAVHLLHRLRETLPAQAVVKLLSVTGCNRVIGKDGRQVEFNPIITVDNKKIIVKSVTIQTGSGGGGLTQMGAVAKKMVNDNNAS